MDGGVTENTLVPSLFSNQEETDTRIILYCKYAQDCGYEYVRVRSPDTDIFFILLHYVHEMTITVLFDTGTGNRRRLINMNDLAEDFTTEYSKALHVFTHCDTTSAFKGIGKVKPIKISQKSPKFQGILVQLGKDWKASSSLIRGLEEFICALYGRKRFSSVDKLRYALVTEKCASDDGSIKLNKNLDLSILPPCSRALLQHILRANYQMAIWRRAHIPVHDIPSPVDDHGWQLVDGNLEPLWFTGDFVPQLVADGHDVADDLSGDDGDDHDDDDDELPLEMLQIDDIFDDSESDNDY